MNSLGLEILGHIQTFRMTIPQVIAKLYSLGEQHAVDILLRLQRLKYIDQAPLTSDDYYYHLLGRAAEPLRLPEVEFGPINGTPKVRAYATLHFCCLTDIYRPLIPSTTFRTRFKTLYRPGPQINYYTEGNRFGYIRVDTLANTAGDASRVIARCAKDIDRRRRRWLKDQREWQVFEEFQHLIDSGRFVVSVLTAFPQKAQRIEDDLNRMRERHYQYRSSKAKREKPNPEFVEENTFREFRKFERKAKPPLLPPPVEVHVVPGLFDVMYPKPS